MILEFGNYKIVTDEKQFIVQKKRIVEAGHFTKEENIGKEYWENDKYYGSLNSALKYLSKTVLLENDDLLVIKKKLKQLESKIDKFTKMLGEDE